MRKLMWFSVGFTAACLLCAYILDTALLFLGVLALIAGIGLCLVREQVWRVAGVILLGLGIGFGWFAGFEALYLSVARAYDGQSCQASVEITDFSYDTDSGVAADGTLLLEGHDFRVRIYVKDVEALKPGDRVEGTVRLRLTVRGGAEEATYHGGDGIFLLAYGEEDIRIDAASALPTGSFPSRLRKEILTVLEEIFPSDTVAFAKALLLGDTTDLSYEEDTDFKLSGIRHVVAVSGLHISILFSLVYIAAGKHRILTALLGIPVLLLFAAVAGFTPSIVRACVMQILVILALLLNKDYDPPTALAAAVLLLLGINPMTVTSVSFQLSVGCMLGIFLFSKKIHDYFLAGRLKKYAKGKSMGARVVRWCVSSISISLGAMSVTTPLSAFYFGTVSVVGILTNLVVLWMISFIFYGIMFSCGIGAAWLAGGQMLAWLFAWPMRLVQWIARLFAGLPLSAVYTCSDYIVLWLVLCYVLLSIFLLQKKRKPILLTLSIAVSLLLAVTVSRLEPVAGGYLATVIDVGQGQCVLLRGKEKIYMVDCGGNTDRLAADAAANLLLSQGITRLDGLIVTHYDQDHVGGVLYLLSRVPADILYLPDSPDPGGYKSALSDLHPESIQWITQDLHLDLQEHQLTIFASDAADTSNESSLCVLFQRENCDILITGDRSQKGERALLTHAQLPELELLVVGHHGSDSSTSLELVSALRPQNAAISVGENNYYGHPTMQVLRLLELFDCNVYRTDLDGTVNFRG